MCEKRETVEIEMDLLKRIAEYYEFPLAVFFTRECDFPRREKTRSELWGEKAAVFDRIHAIVEEYDR